MLKSNTSSQIELTFCFDGSAINLHGSHTQRYGNSVIGHRFLENTGLHWDLALSSEHKSYKLVSLGKAKSRASSKMKFYFSGSGAENCVMPEGGEKIFSPGFCPVAKTFQNCQKPFGVKSLNAISGTGWEHNLGKAFLAFWLALQQGVSIKKIEIMGYSRGAITAIAFSKVISDFYEKYPQGTEPQIHLTAVDPVAGPDYGKKTSDFAQVTLPEPSLPEDFKTLYVDPRFVGHKVTQLHLTYAQEDFRAELDPQMPRAIDPHTTCPLIIPEHIQDQYVTILPWDHYEIGFLRMRRISSLKTTLHPRLMSSFKFWNTPLAIKIADIFVFKFKNRHSLKKLPTGRHHLQNLGGAAA